MSQNIIMELEELPVSNFAFSRYLYVIDDVKSSLLLSILDHSPNEALYWGYELYFSGFKDETFAILLNIANTMCSPKVQRFVQQQKDQWDKTPEQYWILGTVMWYLAERTKNVNPFITAFCQDPDLIQKIKNKSITQKRETNIVIIMEEKDVQSYINIETDKPDRLLQHVLKYSPRNHVSHIFEHDHVQFSREKLIQLWRENWLYYASKSPLWQRRIEMYNGIIDHTNETITFPPSHIDEDAKEQVCNDDMFEEFNAKYYYDTDEQPNPIVERCLGRETDQWTWQTFHDTYAKVI